MTHRPADGVAREGVLPNPKDQPAALAQREIYTPIPSPVAFDLGFPEGRAGSGPGDVLGAAMPKAAVYKHSHFELGKNEVRPDAGGALAVNGPTYLGISAQNPARWSQVLDIVPSRSQCQRPAPPPACDAVSPENPDQPQFGGVVARAPDE